YLTHAEFLQHVASGRIDWGDVDLALDLEEDERIQEILAKDRHLAHLALQIQTQTHTRDSLRWALAEGDWLRAYAPECPETARAHVEASALRHLEELLAARDDQTLAALLQDPATGATPQILK